MITNPCRTCTRYFGALSLAIALISCSLISPTYAAQLYQYKSNGNFANVEWLTVDLVYGQINVSQCGSVNNPQTCQARQKNPGRWARQTRNWEPVKTVRLNPEKKRSPEEDLCNEAA